MASLTRWMHVWVNSWSWWRTGRPGVLRFMGLQRVRHNWATELKSIKKKVYFLILGSMFYMYLLLPLWNSFFFSYFWQTICWWLKEEFSDYVTILFLTFLFVPDLIHFNGILIGLLWFMITIFMAEQTFSKINFLFYVKGLPWITIVFWN